jgi:UDP-N-acetylglucosamine/UDP-N-acetylgalactosamine diphosphorylase
MELRPECLEKVSRLVEKGVRIPNPLTLDIGEEVNPDLISGDDVVIYPGCRIYGSKTVISKGARLGYEGPATIDDCQIGPKVELKGGYFSKSVFLEGSSMGLGAQVREGCILEEQASGAHCVGLKQTILLPFVTLGSLINFCDCLMAGGTSRQDHSEVGSSYIHFNFTPDGDKTTPSLLGDVPRGVMLRERPIFLGGQGGMVGPLRIGYGNVAAAGSILRRDYPEENKLIMGKAPAGGIRNFTPGIYAGFLHIIENNVLYLANLVALEEWYRRIRKGFFDAQELGPFIYRGAMETLSAAKKERLKRLKAMADKANSSASDGRDAGPRREFCEKMGAIEDIFMEKSVPTGPEGARDEFLAHFGDPIETNGAGYIGAIRELPSDIRASGVRWLEGIVSVLCGAVSERVPSLFLFKE